MFGFFVNFVVAVFLTGPIRSLLGVMGMESSIGNGLFGHYAGVGSGFTTNLIEYKQTYGDGVIDYVSDSINGSSMTGFGKKLFNGIINDKLPTKIDAAIEAGKTDLTLADIISKSLAQFITVVCAFIIAFLLIYGLLLLLKLICKEIQKSSFASIFDKIFGGVFGIVRGFMFIVLFFAVLSFFSDNGLLGGIIGYINQSAIGHWLRDSVNTFMVKYIDIKQFIIDILNKI
ncbi:MAG: CvpA family protein [Clostridia bacterium]|nr:CvpA family protein [Clostridia bacterium]